MKKLIFFLAFFPTIIMSQTAIVATDAPSTEHPFAKDIICKDSLKIEKTYDKFTKTTFYKYVGKNITIGKMIVASYRSDYFLYLNLDSDISTSSKGIRVLLSNGELITRSKEYPKRVLEGNRYYYLGSIFIENLDIKSMLTYDITDFRLGVLDAEVKDSYELKEALKCLLKK